VPDDNDVLILPAWIAPYKLFIWDKAGAFEFGAFATDKKTFAFVTNEGRVTSGSLDLVTYDLPKLFAGSAIRFHVPPKPVVVTFSRPFPESPGPEAEQFEISIQILEGVSELPLGNLTQAASTALAQSLDAIRAINDLKDERETVRQVQTYWTSR
jgi:hypothetical protein